MNKKILSLAQDLIEFETVEGNLKAKKAIIDFVKKEFDGLDVNIKELKSDKSPSLLITLDQEDPSLILSGHLDVVPGKKEQFVPKVANGKVYGRGAGDMKFADAAMIEVIKYFAQKSERPSIGLMLTNDEETGGAYGANVLLDGMNPRLAIIPDGGKNLQNIILGQKGFMHLKIWAYGKSSHGSRPFLGDNAIDKIINIYREIEEYISPIKQGEWRNSFNLGKIAGGEAVNNVPDFAEAYFDIRFMNNEEVNCITRFIEKITDGHFEILATASAFDQQPDAFSELFREVAEQKIGKKISYSKTEGSSDAKYFYEKGASVLLTNIQSDNIHADNEWGDVEQANIFYDILVEFIAKISSKLL
jgi:succinyl-diaminopimelate desuccinylase